jgi:protein TonB
MSQADGAIRFTERTRTDSHLSASITSFDRCLVDGDLAAVSSGRRNRRKALGFSIVIEGLLLGLVVLSPLITTVAQPQLRRPLFVPFAPSGRLRAAPMGDPARPPQPSPNLNSHLFAFPSGVATHPVSPAPNDDENAGAGEIDVRPVMSGMGGEGLANLYEPDSVAPPPVVIQRTPPRPPLKVSGGVVEAQLTSRIEPRYPPLALQIRLEGTVQLHAIIAEDGTIRSLEAVSGHPLLIAAALEAVRQRRYRPTLMNGDPVEVDTTITVFFRLHR